MSRWNLEGRICDLLKGNLLTFMWRQGKILQSKLGTFLTGLSQTL